MVLVPVILTGCGEDSSGPAVPVPPPPPPAPPAPPAPPPTPTPTPRPSGTVNVTPESNISQIIASSDPAQPLTIVLQPGVYGQNIVINRSNVTVRGATGNVGDAIVVGAATGAPVQVTNNASGVVLENFSILNTRSLEPIEYGINAEGATEVTVTGVDIVLFPTATPPASRGVAIGFGSAAAGTTSKNLTVTRSNLFVAGAGSSAGIRIAGDNAGINLRVETNNIFLGYGAVPNIPTQLINPAAQDVGAGSAAIFIEPAVTGLSLTFTGNTITPTAAAANVYAIRDDRGSGLSAAERRAIVAAGSGLAFNSNTSNVYLSLTRAIAEAAGPNPTVTAGPGSFTAEGEIVIPADKPGLTLNSLDGTSTLRNVKILANDATLGGTEGNGFRITGTRGSDPDAGGPAVDYQVGIGECDLANQGARNVEVSFNDFARPTQADTYVSVQVCDFSQADIYKNLLRGYTVAGVHVVSAEPATVTIRENRFEASINSPVFIADIVDRQTQASGNLSPFAKASVTGNVFNQPPQGTGAIYARPSVNLTPTEAAELGGEGTILQAFFNNTITPTPVPGVTVCGRVESLAGAPGNLVNFLDSSPTLVPFTSSVFNVVSDALCSAVGFGPGASLQFRPGGTPPAAPTPTPTSTPTPAPAVTITIPGLPAGATVTVTGAGGSPVITTSTSVSGNVATFSGPFTIPFGGQIRITPAIASPSAITVGGTTLNTFDNTTNPGSTTYFNFGPGISVN
ncbi:hypothetical protein NW845_12595 [Synechococcus sp. H60.2]|uniref:hypothetical protein n=1 Tax=Synechococcus sp. H60.2 TaxID=2964518 RepID=UPI0039C2D880